MMNRTAGQAVEAGAEAGRLTPSPGSMRTTRRRFQDALSRRSVWIALAVVAAVAFVAVFSYKKYKKRQLEAIQLDMSTLAKVQRGTLENLFQENGDIRPKKNLSIYSQVSGRVIELLVKDGQQVRRGQRLAVVQQGTAAQKFLPSVVVSPIDGVLMRCEEDNNGYGSRSKKFVERDEYVAGRSDTPQNPTCMMSVADMNSLIVKLDVNEVDVLQFRENMPVSVSVDALPGQKFPAVVSVISKQADEGGRKAGKVFRTEIALNKQDDRLRVGMTGRVSAVMERKENALKVSLSGLFEEDGRTFAYLYVPNDKPRQVEFKPGMRTPLEVEVLEGLKEGDQVFTDKPVEFVPLPKTAAKAASGAPPGR